MRFIFIDRITRLEKEMRAAGIKNLAMNEDYFEYHFPTFPIMPGTLMLEAMVQLSNWLIITSTEFRLYGQLSKIHQVKFRHSLQPGDRLDVVVEWAERREGGILFQGRVFWDEQRIADAMFENRLIDIGKKQKALKRLYRYLTVRFTD